MADSENKIKLMDKAKVARLGKREFKGDGNDTIEKKKLDDQDDTQILGTVTDVKERKNMVANPQFLNYIAEQIADSVIVTNLNYEIIWVNRAFQSLYGYSIEDVLDRLPDFLNAEPNSKEIQNDIYKTVSSGEIWKSEAFNKKKDGSIFPCEMVIFPVLDEQGNTLAYASHQCDITERKKTEQALLESEEKYRNFYEDAPLGYQSLDASGNFLDVNREWLNVFGYSKEEVVGRFFADFVAPESLETFVQNFPRFKADGKTRATEFEMIRKDGSRITVSFNGNIEYDEEGHFKRTHCIMQDITERKETEEALRESEEHFRTLTELSLVGIYRTDKNGNCIYANPQWLEMAGMTMEDAMGKGWIRALRPEDRESIKDKWYKSVQLKGKWGFEYRFQMTNGKITWVYGVARALCDKDGEVTGYIGINTDITERKKAEKTLRLTQFSVDNSTDAVYWVGPDARFIYVNNAAVEALGYSEEELLTMTVHDIDPEFPAEVWPAHWAELKEKKSFVVQAIHQRKDESTFPVEITVNFIQFGDREINCAIARDITERKKAEEKLQQESLMRKIILDHLPCIALIIKKGTREIVVSNEAARKMGAVPGKTCYETYAQRDDPCPFCRAPEVWATNEPIRIEVEYEDTYYDGIWVPLTEELYVHYIFDISERKQAEQKVLEDREQLKSLASQLSLTEERERRRIATELHDQIGQSLVFSKLKLDELHQSATSSELTEALDEICNNIGQIIQDTRTLTFDLSSPILNELGLEAAVADWLDVQIGAKYGIETEFVDDRQQKPLDDDIKALLFRNVRELLVNVIKHAHANKVKVSIRRVNEHIHIDVEDDGKGFDSVKVASRATGDTKFGLFSIRERLEHLGGSFEIDSRPGSGSKFSMKVPIKQM